VLLTTHYMFEADELCDRIAVIAGGQIVATGTPAQLKRGVVDGRVVEVEVYGTAAPALADLRALPGVRSVAVEDGEHAQLVVVRTEAGAEVTPAVLTCLGSRLDGARLGRVATREPSLEDAYVELLAARPPGEPA